MFHKLLCRLTAMPLTLPGGSRAMPVPARALASSVVAGSGLPFGNRSVIGFKLGASSVSSLNWPAAVCATAPPLLQQHGTSLICKMTVIILP